MNGVAVFWGPEAGLSAAAGEAASSVTHLAKLIEGLNGAVQCARLDGLGDDEIADRLSVLSAEPATVRAALADGDGTAMRLLIASLVAAPRSSAEAGHRVTGRAVHRWDEGAAACPD